MVPTYLPSMSNTLFSFSENFEGSGFQNLRPSINQVWPKCSASRNFELVFLHICIHKTSRLLLRVIAPAEPLCGRHLKRRRAGFALGQTTRVFIVSSLGWVHFIYLYGRSWSDAWNLVYFPFTTFAREKERKEEEEKRRLTRAVH